MEKHGSRLLGDLYKDPISSFTHFQKYSVQHPQVIIVYIQGIHISSQTSVLNLVLFIGVLVNCVERAVDFLPRTTKVYPRQ